MDRSEFDSVTADLDVRIREIMLNVWFLRTNLVSLSDENILLTNSLSAAIWRYLTDVGYVPIADWWAKNVWDPIRAKVRYEQVVVR